MASLSDMSHAIGLLQEMRGALNQDPWRLRREAAELSREVDSHLEVLRGMKEQDRLSTPPRSYPPLLDRACSILQEGRFGLADPNALQTVQQLLANAQQRLSEQYQQSRAAFSFANATPASRAREYDPPDLANFGSNPPRGLRSGGRFDVGTPSNALSSSRLGVIGEAPRGGLNEFDPFNNAEPSYSSSSSAFRARPAETPGSSFSPAISRPNPLSRDAPPTMSSPTRPPSLMSDASSRSDFAFSSPIGRPRAPSTSFAESPTSPTSAADNPWSRPGGSIWGDGPASPASASFSFRRPGEFSAARVPEIIRDVEVTLYGARNLQTSMFPFFCRIWTSENPEGQVSRDAPRLDSAGGPASSMGPVRGANSKSARADFRGETLLLPRASASTSFTLYFAILARSSSGNYTDSVGQGQVNVARFMSRNDVTIRRGNNRESRETGIVDMSIRIL